MSLLEQGKKRGLAGEKVDLLEAQLKPTTSVQMTESISQKEHLSFTQQREKVSAKKKTRKNLHQIKKI
jgi:hypothetical protein